MDHEIKLSIQEVKDLVVEQALEFHDKYVEFHASTLNVIPTTRQHLTILLAKYWISFGVPICQRCS